MREELVERLTDARDPFGLDDAEIPLDVVFEGRAREVGATDVRCRRPLLWAGVEDVALGVITQVCPVGLEDAELDAWACGWVRGDIEEAP